MPESVEDLHIGAGSLSIDGTDVGFTTTEGVVINFEPEVHLHMSGKYGNTPVKASLIGQTLSLDVTIAAHTLANIEKSYAGAVLDGGVIKFGGVAGREITGKELVLTPFDGTASWTFKNAVPTSSVAANYQVDNERVITVTFTAMVDVSADEDENLGTVS